ncbi:CBS domain-containing protein [uncultured Marinobacter sp.]|uniref:CBS domain-containing protein n=1 Tax=uncultured Marinobacter sp. TaxID=187379 RepID=UPI0030D8BA65
MAIHISEPGRPQGTRLPEIFRGRRIGDIEESAETHALRESSNEATDGEFQLAREVNARKALERYGQAEEAEPEPQRAYLPVSKMCSPRIHTMEATATLAEALSDMERHGVHHLVIAADGLVGGLIDIRWTQNWLLEHRADPDRQTFQHIELPSFLTVTPETDAHQLARLMLAHQLDAALVVDASGSPTGIVTTTDYLRLYASMSQQEGDV